MPKLPTNDLSNQFREHHDPSLDSQVIREFVRRFPRLQFLTFMRNGIGGPRPMHCIQVVGSRDDLAEAGFPPSGIAAACTKGFALNIGTDVVPCWMVTRNGRRKQGMLEGHFWIHDHDCEADHPMAWLEPRHWTERQDDTSQPVVSHHSSPV